MKPVTNQLVSGGALVYSIVIMIMISLLACLMLLLGGFYGKIKADSENTLNMHLILESVTNGLLASGNPDNILQEYQQSLGTGTFTWFKENWGVFTVIGVSVYHGGDTLSRSMFVGTQSPINERLALYLANHDSPLKMSGKSFIKGNVLIPDEGVERGHVLNKATRSGQMIDGKIGESTKSMTQLEYLRTFTLDLEKKLSETVIRHIDLNDEKVEASFFGSAIQINAERNVGDCALRGKLLVYGTETLILDSTLIAEDIIVYAPTVIVSEGFRGVLQIIAQDSIILEKGIILEYPSAVILIPNENSASGGISIGEKVEINGTVMLIDRNGVVSKPAYGIDLSSDSFIKGELISSGSIDLRGRVYGSVYTDRFNLVTRAGSYDNHILDAYISSIELDSHYVFCVTNSDSSKLSVAKWLNNYGTWE